MQDFETIHSFTWGYDGNIVEYHGLFRNRNAMLFFNQPKLGELAHTHGKFTSKKHILRVDRLDGDLTNKNGGLVRIIKQHLMVI